MSYIIARHLPSYGILSGRKLRYYCCKHIFKHCGKDVNIERGAQFGSGRNVIIGDYSGIGINVNIPNDIIIGNYVMMGPDCYILYQNHIFSNTEVPMMFQGTTEGKNVIIDDDVWIGGKVIITPGRHIAKGTIIAAGCILTKDFPEYSIIGGNPSRMIRMRK